MTKEPRTLGAKIAEMMAPSGIDLSQAKVTIAETDYHDVVEITLTVKCMIDIPYLTRIMESE